MHKLYIIQIKCSQYKLINSFLFLIFEVEVMDMEWNTLQSKVHGLNLNDLIKD